MTILFLGDVVGKPGREALLKALPSFKNEKNVDLCIANGENSAEGNGVSKESAEQLFSAGVDVITGGNHTFRKSAVYNYLNENDFIIRPANWSANAPGKGFCIYDAGKYTAAIINLAGAAYIEHTDNPFTKIDEILNSLSSFNGIKILDFHAESTAEKRSMAEYVKGKMTLVAGTHTHVQTADEKILEGGTAFITDVGMCGPVDSCLGIETTAAIQILKTGLPTRFNVVEKGKMEICGVIVNADEKTGRAESIERIRIII